jgi:hypothetical protein
MKDNSSYPRTVYPSWPSSLTFIEGPTIILVVIPRSAPLTIITPIKIKAQPA